jgi:predicted Zn finger-like uncharacterized protein
MIISCANCIKKFNIDEKLIPENGRLLQCSSCHHKWHYRIPEKENIINDNVILSAKNKQIINNDNKEISINPSLIETSINKPLKKSNIKKYRKLKTKKQELDKEKKNIEKKNSLKNTLNALVVLIITFVAVILILDTFKNNIAHYFPIIIPMMDNLYQSLLDIKSFIKDLIS